MNSSIVQWAIRHQVSAAALDELRAIFGTAPVHVPQATTDTRSEAWVQSQVRLEAAHKRLTLWRNNVGVASNEAGQPVRYGLANDSKRLNESLKSGDLIGWKSVLITPGHIGHTIAQFISRECKRPDWQWTGTERELAQEKWARLVNSAGGDAMFCKGEGTL